MFKNLFMTLSAVLLSFSVFAAETQTNNELPKIEEGKQYVKLSRFPSPNKEVIEIFSFNCPSCYRLDMDFNGSQTIKQNLPKGVKFKKYSLNNFGPLSAELSEAWAIANVLDITDEVALELYKGIQRDRTIKTAKDIKNVFVNLGVDEAQFENMKNDFLVKTFIVQQQEAINDLKPTMIPSFYVNGNYFIIQNGIKTADEFSNIVNYLLELE